MALGSIFTIIGMLFAIGMLPSVTAQRDKFDTIQCSRLVVVNAAGINEVILDGNEHGGAVVVSGKDGEPMVGVGVSGKDDKSGAVLDFTEHGSIVVVSGKDGEPVVGLGITEHGGRVIVFGKGEGKAGMGINENGNGVVTTWDTNGYRQ